MRPKKKASPSPTPTSAIRPTIKINELESLRGIAAVLVIFVHIPKWNSIGDIGLINNAYLMVEFFFVLSGFVIYRAYRSRIHNSNELLKFQFLRLGRLYPVHLLFLFVFVGIELVKYIGQTKYGMPNPNSVPFDTNNLSAFVKNLLLVQAVLPHQQLTFNYPSWSISVEFYTYLVFGMIVLWATKKKRDDFNRSSGGTPSFSYKDLTGFAATSTASLVLLYIGKTYGFTDFLRCLAGFFIGCLTVSVTEFLARRMGSENASMESKFSRVKEQCARLNRNYASLFLLLLTIVYLCYKEVAHFDLAIFFLSAALIATIILYPTSHLNSFLRLKPLVWLGTISYSIYMSHAAVVSFASQFARVALDKPQLVTKDGISIPQLTVQETLVAYSAVIIITIVVSWFSYRWVELPCRDLSRRLVNRWSSKPSRSILPMPHSGRISSTIDE